jgi:hypothetical protein
LASQQISPAVPVSVADAGVLAVAILIRLPFTCSNAPPLSKLVPTKSLPLESMRRRSLPLVCAIMALGAPKFMEALNPVEVLLVVGVPL